MSLLAAETDVILDADGRPLGPELSSFVRAFDRLLTVASYYAEDHEQFVRAVEVACHAMGAAIRPRPALAFELTAAGPAVSGRTLAPHQRPVRQVHDLLASLDLASLEFSSRLTAADLRQTLSALQAHRQMRLRAHSFGALAIVGLPATVKVTCHRVQAAANSSAEAPSAAAEDDLDLLLDAWSEPTGPAPAEGPVQAAFLRDLMAVLQQASEELAATVARQDAVPGSTPLTTQDLAEIQAGVQRLLERDPQAQAIGTLMDLARQALALSGDPGKARLVFDELRKRLDEGLDEVGSATAASPAAAPASEVAALAARVAALAGSPEPLSDPNATARTDQLAIGFALLAAGPRDRGFAPALAALRRACCLPGAGAAEAAVVGTAFADLARRGLGEVIDRALPTMLSDLRAQRPDLVALAWNGVDGDLDPAALALLWPHLVNDLALGLEPAQGPAVVRCCELAGGLALDHALREVPRFLALPGAAREAAAEHAFAVPPLHARSVHAAMLHGAGCARHAARLARELQRRPPDELTGLLVAAAGEGGAADTDLLLDVLREAGAPEPSAACAARATTLLAGALAALPPSRRDEPWVAAAIAWLATHAATRAAALLRHIANDRHWLVRAAWPEACRAAARAASGRGADSAGGEPDANGAGNAGTGRR